DAALVGAPNGSAREVGALDRAADALLAALGDEDAADLPAPVLLTDLAADARGAWLAAHTDLRALLGVPLVARQADRAVGALVAAARDPRRCTPEALRLLGLLGGQLGAALDAHATIDRLRASEERGRLLIERAADVIYMIDEAGYFTYFNPQVEHLIGYAPEELLGKHFATILTPESTAIGRETLRRSVAGEPLAEFSELDVVRRDGEVRTFELRSTNVYDHGHFIGRFGIARDVSERNRLLDELARRNRALEALNAIASLAGRAPDLPALLDAALARTLAVFGIDRGAIFLLDAERGDLALAAHRGFGPDFIAQVARLPADQGLPGRVLAVAAPVIGPDMAADASIIAAAIGAEGIRAYGCVALRAQESVIGLLGVVGRDARVMSGADAETLAVIGAQLGVAIENTRLHEQTRHDLRRENTLRVVLEHISGELELDRLLHTIVVSAVDLLGGDAGSLGLVDQAERVSRIWAWHNIPPEDLLPEVRAGEGVIGTVLAERRSVLVDEYASLPGALPGRTYHSCLAVPVWDRGRLAGTFFVGARDQARRFGPRDVETLELFAKHAALAIGNARLYEEARLHAERLDALREVIEQISSELDLPALLNRMVESAVGLLGADAGSIGLYDEDSDTVRLEATYNLPPVLFGRRIAPGRGLPGLILTRREPVLIAPDEEQPPRAPEVAPGLADVRAHIGVPIWWQGRLVGTFALSTKRPGRRFTATDLEMLALLARHAAVAMENARLYSALQERLSEMVGLGAVGAALIEERNLERVLRTVSEQVMRLTGADSCGVVLLSPEATTHPPGEELELAVITGPTGGLHESQRMPLFGSIAGEAIRTGKPILSNNLRRDPRAFRAMIEQTDIGALLTVPLQTSERTVGAINAQARPGRRFGTRDIEIMTLFAQQAAVAIENARLYERGRELAVAEERNRLAREIHDTLAQGFTGIILQLEVAKGLLADEPAAGDVRERLLKAQELARVSLTEARRSVWNLRPTPLQGRALPDAVRAALDEWGRTAGVATACAVEGAPRPLPAEVETTLLRVTQEALNNIRKHAAAGQVDLLLRVAPDAVLLRVCDDGAGFSGTGRPEQGGGFGLIGMRERLTRVGGHLTIQSTPGRGTCVEAIVPVGSRE
ncbi:MAG TPA: GAF domain-containing protein, partial [Thermomicrobiales bacterium]|nr:GAF domain-containing protein [Thermomicrobiales bacterium]